jgi:hypothetical protein
VSQERAHAEFIGEGEGVPVVGFCQRALQRLAPRRNVAEEAEGIRLVAPFLVLMGECQGTLGEGMRLLRAAGQQMRLTQGETTERLKTTHVRCHGLFHCLCEQRHGFGNASAQDIRRTQGPGRPREKEREVRVLTEAYSLFEQGEGLSEVALAEGQQADPKVSYRFLTIRDVTYRLTFTVKKNKLKF